MAKKSNTLLRVMGILLILSSLVGLLLGLVWYSDAADFADSSEYSTMLAAEGIDISQVANALLVCAVGALIGLIAGIFGVIFASKPNKTVLCLILGVLALALTVVGLILSSMGGGSEIVNSVFFIVTGCAVPALYILGALAGKSKSTA